MKKTIKNNASAEIIEKKSKFIANVYYVQTEEAAEEIINKTKKKYYDARHNCYAYSIMSENGIINRMSDDGEPSGTAGMPILNIITKKEITNVLIIVTRYFGGILLGTGGLVRAYTEAASNAIENTELIYEVRGYEQEIILDYADFEKFQYFCNKNDILITNVEYDKNILCRIEITKEEKDKIEKFNMEGTLKIEKIGNYIEKNIRKNVDK